MPGWLSRLLQAPRFEEDDDRRRARLAHSTLLILLMVVVGYSLLTIASPIPLSRRWPLPAMFGVLLFALRALRRGYVRSVSVVLVTMVLAAAAQGMLTSGGARAPATLTLFLAIVLAGQLGDWLSALVVTLISGLLVWGVTWANETGLIVTPVVHGDVGYARGVLATMVGLGTLVALASRASRATLTRLRQEQQAVERLVEEAPDGILTVDLGGQILHANRVYARMVGLPIEQLVGRYPSDLALVPESRALLGDQLRRLADGEPAELLMVQYVHPDGTTLDFEAHPRVALQPDGSRVVRVVVRDVTRREEADRRAAELEAQLVSARKLEAIGRLAGGVAHDFNNLLTVIVANSHLFDEAELSAEHRQLLSEIRENADRAAALVAQLLAFARKQPVARIPLDLNEVVRSMHAMLERLLGANITLRAELSLHGALTLADHVQVQQVIVNLVANARDAMPDGGSLTVATRRETVVSDQIAGVGAGNYVILEVSDSGKGMDSATRSALFEPFFTTKEVGKGTGLGLATVYGIVKEHDGHIDVSSEVGRGATFRVYWPALDPARASLTPAGSSRPASAPPRQ